MPCTCEPPSPVPVRFTHEVIGATFFRRLRRLSATANEISTSSISVANTPIDPGSSGPSAVSVRKVTAVELADAPERLVFREGLLDKDIKGLVGMLLHEPLVLVHAHDVLESAY